MPIERAETEIVHVRFTANWIMPRELAEAWVKLVNQRWQHQSLKDSGKAVVNSILAAPGGFQPELVIEIEDDILEPPSAGARWENPI